ncbi:MAG: DedA family protein [Phycisphaerae bacterium]|nr:DedA family protein [Phycisphaerae bacterium]
MTKLPWWHVHRHLYDWVLHFSHTPYGARALFCFSFAESSFFPIPPDVLLAPLSLGAPRKWVYFATICSIASVIGGILGYGIGVFLWDLIGPWVFAHLGSIGFTPEVFKTFQDLYNRYDFWIVFSCGFTPLPYKVCTISAGVAEINFAGFIIASVLSRSARFFLVAGLFGWKGETIRPFIEKYFNWLSLAFVALLIGGFAAIKFVRH